MTPETAPDPQGSETIKQATQRFAALDARARAALETETATKKRGPGQPPNYTDEELAALDDLVKVIAREKRLNLRRDLRKLVLPEAQMLLPNVFRGDTERLYRALGTWKRKQKKLQSAIRSPTVGEAWWQPADVEQWTAILEEWGASPEEARQLITRTIALVGQRVPLDDRLAFVNDELVDRAQRKRITSADKLEWYVTQLKKLADPRDFVRKRFTRRQNKSIEVALPIFLRVIRKHRGSASKAQLTKALNQTTYCQTTGSAQHHLKYLCRDGGELYQPAYGRYAKAKPGAVNYECDTDAVRRMLGVGAHTINQMHNKSGIDETRLRSAVGWLKQKGEVTVDRDGILATYSLVREFLS